MCPIANFAAQLTVPLQAEGRKQVKTLNVLLVDDDPAQADLLLECSNVATTHWTFATDGHVALKELQSNARALPDLVLLDLNLPGLDGHEVLRTIRSDSRLRCLPVIIFSHSDARRDVIAAYDGGANSYIRKPLGLDQLQQTISQLETYWSRVATLPPRTQSF